jgi:hypothetical protein
LRSSTKTNRTAPLSVFACPDGEILESEVLRNAAIDPDEDLIGGFALVLLELRVQRGGPVRWQDAPAIRHVSLGL